MPQIFVLIFDFKYCLCNPCKKFRKFHYYNLHYAASFLHSHQRAAQYNNKGALYNGKQPHRQHKCRKNPCYVCKGKNSARPTISFFQMGTPFHYYNTKGGFVLLRFLKLKYIHLSALWNSFKAAKAFQKLCMRFTDRCTLLKIVN